MADIHICRFCHAYSFHANDDMVRYGRRHWAHKTCYIARRGIDGLNKSQIESLPYRAIKDAGLLPLVERRLAECA